MVVNAEEAKRVVLRKGWLAQQPKEFRETLLRRTVLKTYRKGEYVYHAEDAPGMMFGVAEGSVVIGVLHPVAGHYHIHLGRPGDWYGEGAALHGVLRRISVEANVPAQILSLPAKAVREILVEQPLWQKNFSALLLWNQILAIRTIVDLLIRDPGKRVYARLLTLSGVRTGDEIPTGPIELALTQEQFAMMCGLSRKSVQRVLNKMESEGLCENRYAEIVVTSLEALVERLTANGPNMD
jgi:CRP/FNR family cyclic AMP-dependent transcriptional regulator